MEKDSLSLKVENDNVDEKLNQLIDSQGLSKDAFESTSAQEQIVWLLQERARMLKERRPPHISTQTSTGYSIDLPDRDLSNHHEEGMSSDQADIAALYEEELRNQRDSSKQIKENMARDIEKLQNLVGDYEEKTLALQKENYAINAEFRSYMAEMDSSEKGIIPRNNTSALINDLNQKCDKFAVENEHLTAECSALKSEIATLQTTLAPQKTDKSTQHTISSVGEVPEGSNQITSPGSNTNGWIVPASRNENYYKDHFVSDDAGQILIDSLSSDLSSSRFQLEALQQRYTRKRERHRQKLARARDHYRGEWSRLRAELVRRENGSSRVASRLAFVEQVHEDTVSEMRQLTCRLSDSESQLHERSNEVVLLKTRCSTIESQMTRLLDQLEVIGAERNDLLGQVGRFSRASADEGHHISVE